MGQAPRAAEGLVAAEIAAWLRAHPRFLAEQPELYRWLAPPERVHGERLADHMAAMLRAERAHAAAMAERADGVLAAGRAAAGLAARVQEAVLALIAAANPADCVALEFPPLLAVDAASLCAEDRLFGARLVPAGTLARLLGGRAVLFRESPDDAPTAARRGRGAGGATRRWCAFPARDRRRCWPWWRASRQRSTRRRAPGRSPSSGARWRWRSGAEASARGAPRHARRSRAPGISALARA